MSLFPHTCTITRPAALGSLDEYGQPVAEGSDTTVYDDDCRVFEDGQQIKRMADSSEALEGKALIRLQKRPQGAIDQTQDRILAVFNGATRKGHVRRVSHLAHYPRLMVEWDD